MGTRILLIDLDDVTLPFPKGEYEKHAEAVLRHFGYTLHSAVYRLSQNRGIHVTVFVEEPVEPLYVPLLQYLLGSDPKRECINYFRMRWGIDLNVLFTAKRRYTSGQEAEITARPSIGAAVPTFRRLAKNFNLCPGFKRMVELAEKSGVRRYEPNLNLGPSTL